MDYENNSDDDERGLAPSSGKGEESAPSDNSDVSDEEMVNTMLLASEEEDRDPEDQYYSSDHPYNSELAYDEIANDESQTGDPYTTDQRYADEPCEDLDSREAVEKVIIEENHLNYSNHSYPIHLSPPNSRAGVDPGISKRPSRKYEAESGDNVSDISSSSGEEDESVDHLNISLKGQSQAGQARPDISGADLICNRSRVSGPTARTDFKNHPAMSTRLSNTGSAPSAYHKQPITSSYGFSAMYEDAASRRSASSGGSNPWRSSDVNIPIRASIRSNSRSDGTSNLSPYYEHTGGWLRLRPQNPGNFQYNSSNFTANRFRTQQNRNFSQYYSSSSARSMSIDEQHSSKSDNINDPMPMHLETDSTVPEEDKLNTIHSEDIRPSYQEDAEMGGRRSENLSAHEYHEVPNVINKGEGNGIDQNDHPSNQDNPENEFKHDLGATEESPPLRTSIISRSVGTGIDTQWASPDSKFERYACRVDQSQGDKSIEIPLFLFQRPHMRAFHYAWISFFIAFFTWFAISPLLPEIKNSLGLTHREIWMSNVFSSAGTVICRVIVGPLCDRFGARWVMALTLVISSIPVMATGLVNNAVELCILRLITGIAGSSFVTCQYWTSSMFSREIAGTANSLAAGWGNLGGGVTNIVMGSALFPLFKLIYGESGLQDDEDVSSRAWRTVCIAPAILSFSMAFFIIKYSDDSPKGNYMKLKRLGLMPKVEAVKALKEASRNYNTWILFIQYGMCFGIEVTMTAGAALYFSEEFKQSTESAAALASIFGWLNLFARGLGGFISDIMNVKLGMRGRLMWHIFLLILEGIFVLAFGYVRTLGSAICIMVCFSLFVQCAEVSLGVYFLIYEHGTNQMRLLTIYLPRFRDQRTVLFHMSALKLLVL